MWECAVSWFSSCDPEPDRLLDGKDESDGCRRLMCDVELFEVPVELVLGRMGKTLAIVFPVPELR